MVKLKTIPRTALIWRQVIIISSYLLKKFLGGKRFDDIDLKDAAQKWLTLQVAVFFGEGLQKLVPHYDKCLNNGGEYVGKWFEECRIR
jgi:hypothetical protein